MGNTKQDDRSISLAAKINPVSRTKVNLVFRNPLSDLFYVRKIALLKSVQSGGNLGGCLCANAGEPLSKNRHSIL